MEAFQTRAIETGREDQEESRLLSAIRQHLAEHTIICGNYVEYVGSASTAHCEAMNLLSEALAEMSTCESCGLD
jgi:polysaccharide deacetylase 2 family uncharacterized protein YibQ